MNTPSVTAPAAAEDKLDFKKIFPIFIVVLVDLLGLTIIIPLLPLYAATFNADPSMIGLIGAAYPLAQVIGAPILGRLSDRFGRKPILILSQIGTFIGFMLLGFANNLPMLFLARILDGLSGGNIAMAQAMIADSTTEKTRTQGLGLLGAAFGLGFILGPLLAFGSLALSGNNYQVPAFIAAIFSAISIALTYFWLPESKPTAKAESAGESSFSLQALIKTLTHPLVGLLLVLIFFQQVSFGGFEQFLALFTLGRLGVNASGNAIIFVFVGIIIVMVQGYFIGKWSRRFGERNLIVAGLALLTLGLALTALTPTQAVPWYNRAELVTELTRRQTTDLAAQSLSVTLPAQAETGWAGLIWLLIAMIPASIGGGILQPSINSLITKRISADERGGVLGISASVVSLANVIAPLMGGVLLSQSLSLPFGVWAAMLGVLLIVVLVALKAEAGATVKTTPASASQ